MLIFGHRGAMGHAPENTLEAMRVALEMGVDWVELDVHVVEGELVVIHDSQVDRTTNGKGDLADFSLAELRELDAGNGEKIPLLSEIFDFIDRRVGINVELKGAHTAEPAVSFLEKQIEKGWPVDKILLSSFDHQLLLEAKNLNPVFRRAALYFGQKPDYEFLLDELQAYAVHPFVFFVDQELIEKAHANGLKVFVYTVNEPDDISRMRDLKVDGIFTNFPDRV